MAQAIGQMTRPILFEGVMRGQELTEKVTLFSSQEGDVTYGLAGGGDIENWVTFYAIDDTEFKVPITEVTVPSKSQVQVMAKFLVPADAPNGTYKGVIAVTGGAQAEQSLEENSVQVMDRVDRAVSITVTDKEKIELKTSIIPLEYGISNSRPLKVKAVFNNTGNVSLKPSVQLKIAEIATGNSVHNAIYPYPDSTGAVKPFEEKSIENFIVWQPASQPLGQYRATAAVMINGQAVSEESFNFDILDEAVASNMAANAGAAVKMDPGAAGWMLLAGFLAAAAVIGIAGRFIKKSA